jgi:exopolysaccharide biosynthesis polyprenyl glycosylphosphotransferase
VIDVSDQRTEVAPERGSAHRAPDAEPRAFATGVEAVLSPATWRRKVGQRLALVDAVVIAAASLLAYVTRELLGRTSLAPAFASEVAVAIAIAPMWLALFYLAGAYRPEYLNAGGDASRRFVAGVAGGVFTLGFTSFILNLQLSRLFVLLVAVYVLLGGGLARLGVRRFVRTHQARGRFVQRAVVVGTDADASQLAVALNGSGAPTYRVVGYLDESAPPETYIDGIPVLGGTDELLRTCEQHGIGVVIVSPSGVSPGTLRDVTIALEGSPVDLAVAPSLFQVVTRRMTIETVAGVPLLHVDQIRLERGKAAIKRFLDLIVATSLLVLSAPIWLAASLAVRVTSPGPVLFRQARVGRDGRSFEILKFRTMVVDAEERFPDVAHLNSAGSHFFKVADDPRVTPVGRHLRRWSIDELPQLLNVLRGDMSMVGPRPPLPSEVAGYDAWHLRRLRVRPGITGVWQVSGRSNVPFDEAVRMDLFYIENWSLGYDLFLLAKTVRAVLGRDGAY